MRALLSYHTVAMRVHADMSTLSSRFDDVAWDDEGHHRIWYV